MEVGHSWRVWLALGNVACRYSFQTFEMAGKSKGKGPGKLALWCFIEGSSAAFKVTVPKGDDIDDVKAAIQLKKPVELGRVDAVSLVIWKVRMF
jgi:hypothetical protein